MTSLRAFTRTKNWALEPWKNKLRFPTAPTAPTAISHSIYTKDLTLPQTGQKQQETGRAPGLAL
jgi:hypothetical protein